MTEGDGVEYLPMICNASQPARKRKNFFAHHPGLGIFLYWGTVLSDFSNPLNPPLISAMGPGSRVPKSI